MLVLTYKGLDGRDRWLGVSSTTFQDREKETVSSDAIINDVARTYGAIEAGQAQDHGPLLFWHTPLELGRCDYRLFDGHSLIEGGYFHSEKAAQLIRPGDQMSLAFRHPFSEPDNEGNFYHIQSVERSNTPSGRAANPYTTIMKEIPMQVTEEKKKEYLARGGDPELLERLLLQQAETEKEAISAGVRYKADDDAEEEAAGDDDDRESEVGDNLFEEETEETLFNSADGEFLGQLLDQRFKAYMEPLMKAMGSLNTHDKMRGMMDELKQMVGGQMSRKDDEVASLKQSIKELSDRLAEIEGFQPKSSSPTRRASGGYRASEANDTVVVRVTEKEADGPSPDPVAVHLKHWNLMGSNEDMLE